MQFDTLPQLGDSVSKICLGTMTWGQQNSEQDAHEQMDYALAQGVNFWDTAEMYPSPPDKDKQGDTERFMGSWFAKQANEMMWYWRVKSLAMIFCAVAIPSLIKRPFVRH
jgi:aryl-alcohol dehydrogenase-like predicted oxidoreductase